MRLKCNNRDLTKEKIDQDSYTINRYFLKFLFKLWFESTFLKAIGTGPRPKKLK